MSNNPRSKNHIPEGVAVPMRIGASVPIIAIRNAYNVALHAPETTRDHLVARGVGPRAAFQTIAEIANASAILASTQCFAEGALTDAQIVAIAKGEATLRGWSDTGMTYHDAPCALCGGIKVIAPDNKRSVPCYECGGDGFAPPVRPPEQRNFHAEPRTVELIARAVTVICPACRATIHAPVTGSCAWNRTEIVLRAEGDQMALSRTAARRCLECDQPLVFDTPREVMFR